MSIQRIIKTETCALCAGRGVTAVRTSAGRILKREREEAGVPRVSKQPGQGMAELLQRSEAYIIKIEEGGTRITWDVIDRFRAAVTAAKDARANAPKPICLCDREFESRKSLLGHQRTCAIYKWAKA